MNISDIVVLVIVAVTVLVCSVKGLAMTIYSMFSSIIAFVGALLLRPFVSAGLLFIGLDKLFYNSIYKSICNSLDGLELNNIGTGSKIAEVLNIPDFAKGLLESNVSNWETSGSVETIVEEMSAALSNFIVDVISVILLLVIILIVMRFLKGVLKFLSKIPVIKQVDKFGGFVVGIVLAFFWVSIGGMVLHLFSTAAFFPVVLSDLETSLFAHYFYDTNFIALLISNL